MQVIKPPTRIPYDDQNNRLFLAGTIDMGDSIDWQAELTDRLTGFDNLTVYNPRRDGWDSSWEQTPSNPNFREQVNWELEGLNSANIIFFNFLPNSKSPVTMMELGLVAPYISHTIIVCCPKEFWRAGNVEIVTTRYDHWFCDNFEDAFWGLEQRLLTP